MAGTVIEELVALLGWDLTGEEDLKRFNKGLRDAERGLESFARQASLFAAAAATAFAGAMTVFGKSVISTSANFEQMTSTLEIIEGSSEKAKQSMDWVAEFAKTTPYELDQVASSFVRLRAYGLDPMDGTLRAVGNAASAMGKDLMSGVEAIADAATGENERLKEFGITASVAGKQVTYAWQQNGEQMTRTVKKNGVEITKTLTDIFERRFGGAMDKQSKNWNGMWSNMLDSWTDFQKRVGEAGFFDSMKDRLGGLLDYIGQLDREGKLDEWAQSISDAMVKGVDAFTNLVSHLKRDFETIMSLEGGAKKIWEGMKTALIALGVVLFPTTSLIALAALAVDDFLTYMRGGESVIGSFIDKIQELTGVSDGVAKALGGLGATVMTALTGAFILRPGTVIKTFGAVLVRGIIALAGPIATALATALGLLSNPVGWGVLIAGSAAALVYVFWDDLVAAWDWLGDQISTLWGKLSGWFSNVDWSSVVTSAAFPLARLLWDLFFEEWTGLSWADAGSQAMTKLWNGMKSIGSSIKSWFSSLVPDWATEWLGGGGVGLPNGSNDNSPMQNAAGNIGAMMGSQSSKIGSTVNDNRTANQTNNVTINQNVTQPTQAPAAAASATGNAVTRGLDPARMNGGGGF